MSKKSKAAVLVGRRQLEIREFDLPEIGEDDGLLQIEATGVCGTDWSAYKNPANVPVYEVPCVLGHEMVGRVVKVGSKAAKRWGVKEGDRVAVEEYLPCGQCPSCLAGHYQTCKRTRYGGKSIHDAPSLWGGYSDYLYLHPDALLHKVSTDVPAELTQLFVPISNGLHWVQEVGNARIGATVVVQAPGPHGLSCVVGAKEAGAGCVIMIGRSADEQRLAVARELGADYTLHDDVEDVVQRVREITDGRMADTVVNVVPAPQAFATSVQLAGERATVVHVGISGGKTDAFPGDQIIWKELTVKGVLGRPNRTVGPALRLIESGKYPLEKMCTHRYPVVESEAALLTAGGEGEPGAIRVSVINEAI